MEDKKNLIDRLKRVEGQVRGVQRMVEEDKYCMDVLSQVAAVQNAIDKVSQIVLKNHINSCLTNAIRSGSELARAKKVDELMKIFSKFGGKHK